MLPFSSQMGTTGDDSSRLHEHSSRRGRDSGTETCMYHTTHKGHGLAVELFHSHRKSLDPHQRLQKHGPRMNIIFSKSKRGIRPSGKEARTGQVRVSGYCKYQSQPWVLGKVTHTRGKAQILLDGKQKHS